ncbi:hypothetical protein ACES2I_06605 [Bdellovibrio bacteriovorus]|uniref:hypothetical protein n=1 Tax=Bdellovibrio bacteriovorus TaxID=959 RepID=UPI0035A63928
MPPISLKTQLKLRFSTVLWFILFCLFLLGVPSVKAWTPWLMAAVIGASFVLAGIVYGLFCLIRKSQWSLGQYIWTTTLLVFILTSVVGLPVYYFNYVATATPITVPQVTMTNGQKTVVFQGMMHIGSESFYKSVVYDLENALSSGYKLYYEGIRPGTPASDKWFKDILAGGKDLSGNYRSLATLCGLKFQLDYFPLVMSDQIKHPERHLVADISTETMQNEYNRLIKSDTDFSKAMEQSLKRSQAPDDLGSIEEFVKWQQAGDKNQKLVSGIVCRGFMTRALQNANDKDQPLNRVILDFRNRNLADFIHKDKSPKIYVTYGSAHIKGVLAELQSHDPKWNIKSVKWSRVIAAPEELTGEL